MHSTESSSRHAGAVAMPDFRQTVAAAAKRFKSSWVELGKLLVEVNNQGLYEGWGYPTFDAYCLSELRIKKQTAMKLIRNFSFLDKHEPEQLRRDDIVERAPAFEVVEVLAQAEERGQLSAPEYKSIRDSIWNSERPPAELRREVLEKFPPPPPAPLSDEASARRWVSVAKKLAAELSAASHVPKKVTAQADDLVEALEALAKDL